MSLRGGRDPERAEELADLSRLAGRDRCSARSGCSSVFLRQRPAAKHFELGDEVVEPAQVLGRGPERHDLRPEWLDEHPRARLVDGRRPCGCRTAAPPTSQAITPDDQPATPIEDARISRRSRTSSTARCASTSIGIVAGRLRTSSIGTGLGSRPGRRRPYSMGSSALLARVLPVRECIRRSAHRLGSSSSMTRAPHRVANPTHGTSSLVEVSDVLCQNLPGSRRTAAGPHSSLVSLARGTAASSRCCSDELNGACCERGACVARAPAPVARPARRC